MKTNLSEIPLPDCEQYTTDNNFVFNAFICIFLSLLFVLKFITSFFFNGFCHLSHLNKNHQKWFPVVQIRLVNIPTGFTRVAMDSWGPAPCEEVPITTIEGTLQQHTSPPHPTPPILLTREYTSHRRRQHTTTTSSGGDFLLFFFFF